MFKEIGDMLKLDRSMASLRAGPNVVVPFGFYIGTGDSGMIEDNLRERGHDPEVLGWSNINDNLHILEGNVYRMMMGNGLVLRAEGHGDNGDLSGSAWLHTLEREGSPLNTTGMEILKDMLDSGESLNTSSGSITGMAGFEKVYERVDPIVADAADIVFGIFSTAKLKFFFEAIEDGKTVEEIAPQIETIEESFLAPPAPPGIFRKVTDGVEIFSARCPGCKRIHGNFRTYDQAAGNRQCKFCTRDYVDKMMKVSTTGNFKHLLKKDHEARASRTYR